MKLSALYISRALYHSIKIANTLIFKTKIVYDTCIVASLWFVYWHREAFTLVEHSHFQHTNSCPVITHEIVSNIVHIYRFF